MTDTELLDWFDINKIESGFAVTAEDGEPVIVTGDSIRDMLLTAMTLRGPRKDPYRKLGRVH